MSIEIIPRVVEALHSREASLRASRECNASTTRGIISILIVLVGSSYIIFFGFFPKYYAPLQNDLIVTNRRFFVCVLTFSAKIYIFVDLYMVYSDLPTFT